jgi:hypothetical protein
MILFTLISLAYCSYGVSNIQENTKYNIKNVATSFYLSNKFFQSEGIWPFISREEKWDIYATEIGWIFSEWIFVSRHSTYDGRPLYSIVSTHDSRCINVNPNVFLDSCNHGTFQQWVIYEMGEKRYKLIHFVEQMALASNTNGYVYLKDTSIKSTYQQWYIEPVVN